MKPLKGKRMSSQEYIDLKVDKSKLQKLKSFYKEKSHREMIDHILDDMIQLKSVFTDQQHTSHIHDADDFDFNPFLEELNAIVRNGNFKDITDQPQYFENRAKRLKSIE